MFFTETINYLGHDIHIRRLDIVADNTDSIRGLQEPTNFTELRSFLGSFNVFRRFALNIARLAASLNAKFRKDQPKTFESFDDKKREFL